MHNLIAAAMIFAAVLPVSAASLEQRLAPCLACHGEKGQSKTPEVPSLGGQTAFYVLVQLYLFRQNQRVVEVMNEPTKNLTDDDLRNFSDFIAKLPPPSPAEPVDAARVERARALIHQHRCNFCHRADFSGQEHVPRISGQREDYLVKAMREYKSSARHGYDPAMAMVLQPIDDQQILDLAYYLAGMR